ncbi:hypothetical protein [Spongiimicrobium sp. 3-5]|uniref:hypothetical protein n=1 Tax=Spongiimicrobium sp. 3-5 TaxID=3332596 RepID=UPI00397FD733
MKEKNLKTPFCRFYYVSLLGFLALTLGFGIPAQNQSDMELIQGKWDWVYTKGKEKGETYNVTPQSMNMSVTYNFVDKDVKIYVNGVDNEMYPFYFSADTLKYGQEVVLYRLSGANDSLILSNSSCCDDVFEKAFVRTDD